MFPEAPLATWLNISCIGVDEKREHFRNRSRFDAILVDCVRGTHLRAMRQAPPRASAVLSSRRASFFQFPLTPARVAGASCDLSRDAAASRDVSSSSAVALSCVDGSDAFSFRVLLQLFLLAQTRSRASRLPLPTPRSHRHAISPAVRWRTRQTALFFCVPVTVRWTPPSRHGTLA